MIGSGIFLLPASLAFYGGISMVGWLISAIGAILLATLCVLVPYLFSAATHILLSYEKGKKWTWVLGMLTFLFSMWAVIGSGQEVVFLGICHVDVGAAFVCLFEKG